MLYWKCAVYFDTLLQCWHGFHTLPLKKVNCCKRWFAVNARIWFSHNCQVLLHSRIEMSGAPWWLEAEASHRLLMCVHKILMKRWTYFILAKDIHMHRSEHLQYTYMHYWERAQTGTEKEIQKESNMPKRSSKTEIWVVSRTSDISETLWGVSAGVWSGNNCSWLSCHLKGPYFTRSKGKVMVAPKVNS